MRWIRRGAVPLVLLVSIVFPASGVAFQKAIWGTPGVVHGVNQFALYHRMGVTIDEMDLDWDQVAPTRPKDPTSPKDPAYIWPAEVSQAIAAGKRYGITVLLQIRDAPAWANGGHANPAYAPRNPADFAAFASAAAREYPAVHLWMIWGEPTRAGLFEPMAPSAPLTTLKGAQLTAPHLYARMLDDSYGALKAISIKNLVIGGDTYTAGNPDPLQWIANLKLPDGKAPRMDMYGHNPFTYETPVFSQPMSPFDEVQFSDLHELAGWVDHYLGKNIPLFLSEFTIPTQTDNEFDFSVKPKYAGQWVADVLRESRAWHRIYALGWVNVYDNLPTSAGGLFYENGKPKPSYYAFKNG